MRILALNEHKQVSGGFFLPGSSTVSSFGGFAGFVNAEDKLQNYLAQQEERRFLAANPTFNSADFRGL